MLKDRCRKILYELTNDPGITSKDLEEKLGLSSRQLGYSIEKVNEWLLEHDYPVIERTRKGHFVIDQSILSQLSNAYQADVVIDSMILTEEQRIPLILMMMMSSDEELSLNHFAIELDVSKNTVLNDIKQAQSYLDQYHLQIKYSRKNGYLIEGQEFQIRKLLSLVTGLILNMPHGEEKLKEITNIREEQISEFTKRLENVENQLRYTFTDERMGTMPYILILILRRIKKDMTLRVLGLNMRNCQIRTNIKRQKKFYMIWMIFRKKSGYLSRYTY